MTASGGVIRPAERPANVWFRPRLMIIFLPSIGAQADIGL